MSLHLGEHPLAVGLTAMGVGGAATGFSFLQGIHPTLQSFIGVIGATGLIVGALFTAASRIYKPARKFFATIREYVDADKKSSEQQVQIAEANATLLKQLRQEMASNTSLTTQAVREVTQMQKQIAEHGDTRVMVEELRGELTAQMAETREGFGELKEAVKGSFEQLRTQYNGLGISLRKEMEALRDELRAHAERLLRLEEKSR